MRKRSVMILAAAFLTSAILAGCSSNKAPLEEAETSQETPAAEASSEESAEQKKDPADITVAGVVFQDDQFMSSLLEGYTAACEEYGVNLLTANTENDQAKESELIETYTNQGVAGIAIAPLDPSSSIAALKDASDLGVKIAITNMEIDTADFIVCGFTSSDYSNAHQLGEAAAERLLKQFGEETIKMGIINYEDNNPEQSASREKGFFDALTEAGVNYEILAEAAGSSIEMSMQAGQDMMTANPDIQVLYACNGLGYIGPYNAFKDSGYVGNLIIYGYDANDMTTDWLFDDPALVHGEVAQDPYQMGYNAMKVLIQNILGEDTSEYAGHCEYVPGAVLVYDDLERVKTWRVSMGYAETPEN